MVIIPTLNMYLLSLVSRHDRSQGRYHEKWSPMLSYPHTFGDVKKIAYSYLHEICITRSKYLPYAIIIVLSYQFTYLPNNKHPTDRSRSVLRRPEPNSRIPLIDEQSNLCQSITAGRMSRHRSTSQIVRTYHRSLLSLA